MKRRSKILICVAIVIFFLVKLCGNDSFAGTYVVDLTRSQSGHETTIVLNPDGTGYFKDGDSYTQKRWWSADNGGGIKFSGGGADEQACYYMNKQKTKMYWGLDDYMNDRNGYVVKKID